MRGRILDRSGTNVLAENEPTYNVSLYLDELRTQFKAEWQRNRPTAKLTRNERISLEAQARYRVVSKVVQNLGTGLDQPT